MKLLIQQLKNIRLIDLILVGIILFLLFKNDNVIIPGKETITKTVEYQHVHDTISSKPILVKSEKIKWDTINNYTPDTNYYKLVIQYRHLADSLFTKKYYSKNYNIDTFGTLTVQDTILQNNLIGQSISYNLRIPKQIIRITKTEPYKSVNQLYLGGVINIEQSKIINSIESNILFKTKHNNIYQLGLQKSLNNKDLYLKLGTYFKL